MRTYTDTATCRAEVPEAILINSKIVIPACAAAGVPGIRESQ